MRTKAGKSREPIANYQKQVKITAKSPDLSKLIKVKLDEKTTMFIEPGKDIQKAIEKYNNRNTGRRDQAALSFVI
jgi:hypothetical protein